MAKIRWWRAATILLAVGAAAGVVLSLAKKKAAVGEPRLEAEAKTGRAVDIPVSVVKPGKLRATVEEWGIVEATQDHSAISEVSQAPILSILPEGTKVSKGQLVCELNSSSLRDQLANQVIAVQQAEAAYRSGTLERQNAELSLAEYERGDYPQQLNDLAGKIAVAQRAIQKAEERRDRIMRARKRLDVLLAAKGEERTAAELLADLDFADRLDDLTMTLSRDKTTLEQTKVARDVFEKWTATKKTRELKADIEKARHEELARQSAWEQEKAKDAGLRKQIESCRIVAPADGVIVYANDPVRFGPEQAPQIEEGAIVRERQKIFSIPDLSVPMRVNVNLPDWMIVWVMPGLRARIKVEGLAGEPLPGVVLSVARYAALQPSGKQHIRAYTTHVAIEQLAPGLAPGMTALVEVLTAELDNVLSVPVPSVVYYDKKDHVAVRRPDGGFDWREVTLGLSDGAMVEVKQGLKDGDAVALEPDPLLSGGQKLRISRSAPRPAPKPARPAVSPSMLRRMARPGGRVP